MKQCIKNILLKIQKVKFRPFFIKLSKYVKENKKIVLIFFVSLLLIILLLNYFLSFKLKASTKSLETKGLSEVIDSLEFDSGEQLVYENDTKQLYIDTETTNIKIVDKSSGKIWNTLGESIGSISPENSMSPFSINYYKGLELITQDAYSYSIVNEDGTINDESGFEINVINNGVQLIYYLEDLNFLKYLFEYIPRQMKIESYENKILGKLDLLKEEGEITILEYQKYLTTFNSVYKYDDKEDPPRYSYSYSGYPPVNRAKQLLNVFEIVGYTREDLVEDNDYFGILTPSTKLPKFKVVMEVTLENDDLMVRIPTYEMTTIDKDIQISSLKLFPYFGDVNGNTFTDGVIFVPDGSGALIDLNSYTSKFSYYMKEFYDNDIYSNYYYRESFNEPIKMPIFGMLYGTEDNINQGYLAIIEQGAELSKLYVNPGNVEINSQAVNRAYVEFQTYQKAEVNMYGEYSQNDTAKYLFKGNFIDYDFEIRYKLLVEEDQSYYTLAKTYQEYLMEKYDLEKNFEDKTPQILLDIIGSVEIKKRFLGIPYDSMISMTTYDQLYDILQKLEGINYVVNYRGAFNGGLNQSLPTKIDMVDENGDFESYKNLINYINEKQQYFFFDVLFATPYKNKENGFNKNKNGAIGFNNEPITRYQYNLASQIQNTDTTPWYLLDVRYLDDVINNFIKNYDLINNIAVRDLGNIYFADNGAGDLNPILANNYVNNALNTLAKNYELILNDPTIDYGAQVSYVNNLSRESSDYGIFTTTVPFKELVLNGLVNMYSRDVNMYNDQNLEYFLLQAIETGVNPKFTLSYENSNKLMETEFNYLYSTTFDNWQSDIVELWEEYNNIYNQIGTFEIVDHQILDKNVYKTTYSSGVEVIVNYNDFEVEVENEIIQAKGYMLGGVIK